MEQVISGEFDNSRRRKVVEKGYKKVNMVQILCIHECKQKEIPVETIS
jgi:hypothetical protein